MTYNIEFILLGSFAAYIGTRKAANAFPFLETLNLYVCAYTGGLAQFQQCGQHPHSSEAQFVVH